MNSASNPLCLECGLCCNGVIFSGVNLQPGDDPTRLRSLGLALVQRQQRRLRDSAGRDSEAALAPHKFLQPCVLLEGCACRGYAERPKYCREFECLLLKSVHAGRMEISAARALVRFARQRADTVRSLLRELGDRQEHVALSLRFRRVKRHLESNLADDESAEVFSRLTLAMHDLNVLLSEAFYPVPRQ